MQALQYKFSHALHYSGSNTKLWQIMHLNDSGHSPAESTAAFIELFNVSLDTISLDVKYSYARTSFDFDST